MSDNFNFDVSVCIYDKWQLGYADKEKGDEIKKACVIAVIHELEKFGFNPYKDEFWVNANG
jgi:hypothetical protein